MKWPLEWEALKEIFYFTDVGEGDVADLLLLASSGAVPRDARHVKYKLYAKLMKWGKRIRMPLPAAAEAIMKRVHENPEGQEYVGFVPATEDANKWEANQVLAHRRAVLAMAGTQMYDVWFNPLEPTVSRDDEEPLPPSTGHSEIIVISDDEDAAYASVHAEDVAIVEAFDKEMRKALKDDDELSYYGDDENVLDEIEQRDPGEN